MAFKVLSAVVNFFTMDLFNSFLDERIYTDCADVNRMNGDNQDTAQSRNTPSLFPTRTLHSPFGRDGNGNEKHDPDENYNGNANGKTCLLYTSPSPRDRG